MGDRGTSALKYMFDLNVRLNFLMKRTSRKKNLLHLILTHCIRKREPIHFVTLYGGNTCFRTCEREKVKRCMHLLTFHDLCELTTDRKYI